MTEQNDNPIIRHLEHDFLSPLLQEHGFKQRGLTWNQAVDDMVRVLDVQLSKFSGPDRIDLTVNVGIWMRPVWRVSSAKKAPAFIEEHDCWPSFRIGQVMAEFHRDAIDKWWTLVKIDDVRSVGVDMRESISSFCVPFLKRFSSLVDVKRFYDAADLRIMPGGKLQLAILNNLLGDRESYERLIADLADKKFSFWHARVAEVVNRLDGWSRSIPR